MFIPELQDLFIFHFHEFLFQLYFPASDDQVDFPVQISEGKLDKVSFCVAVRYLLLHLLQPLFLCKVGISIATRLGVSNLIL